MLKNHIQQSKKIILLVIVSLLYICIYSVHMYMLIMIILSTSLTGAMAEALVKDMIQKNAVMVFSKTYCPFCTMAKQALQDAGLKEVISVAWIILVRKLRQIKVNLSFCYVPHYIPLSLNILSSNLAKYLSPTLNVPKFTSTGILNVVIMVLYLLHFILVTMHSLLNI